jgi:DNA-binding protein YbaB
MAEIQTKGRLRMDRTERDAIRHRNDTLREQVDTMLDTLRRQQSQLAGVREKLAAVRAAAWSADRTVKVTVNAAGVVVDTALAPETSRAQPETLARAFTDAAQRAVHEARKQAAAATAPITQAADEIGDLPALVPGAPSLRELRGALAIPEPTDQPGLTAPAPTAPGSSEGASAVAHQHHRPQHDDDDWGQPDSWLESVR